MFEKFAKEARVAVIVAQEEAKDLGHPAVGPEHLVLGVLQRPEPRLRAMLDDVGMRHADVRACVAQQHRGDALGVDDAEALKAIGIDLDAVRESLAANFGADVLDRQPPSDRSRGWFGKRVYVPFTKDAKKSIELSLREALAHKDSVIAAEHLLLGVLRADNAACRAVIATTRVDPDELRRRLHVLLDEAA
ncbi:MAG: Clp protease [Mycobacteriaceae bacterium]|nr:Clp protease [Mycobacteriaceae bacterium]